MPSTIATSQRRQPRQARAAQRRTSFLDAAARIIGETGYESLTMTAVAEQAGASIGTLYDYFPDKRSLAHALAAQYTEEADTHWKELLIGPLSREKDALAKLFIDGAMVFVHQRPAYLPLSALPQVVFRSSKARQDLRKAFAEAFRQLNPNLTKNDALIGALIVVEMIKASLAVCKEVSPRDCNKVTAAFEDLLASHLNKCLGMLRFDASGSV